MKRLLFLLTLSLLISCAKTKKNGSKVSASNINIETDGTTNIIQTTRSVNFSCEQLHVTNLGVTLKCDVSLDDEHDGAFIVAGDSLTRISLPSAYQNNLGKDAGLVPENYIFDSNLAYDTTFLPYNQNTLGCSGGNFTWFEAGNTMDLNEDDICFYFSDGSYTKNLTRVDVLQITIDPESLGTEAHLKVGGLTKMGDFWYARIAFHLEGNSSVDSVVSILDLSQVSFDLDNDGIVGTEDLFIHLKEIGSSNSATDFDGNGIVNGFDTFLLKHKYGSN